MTFTSTHTCSEKADAHSVSPLALELVGVCRSFGALVALKDINLEIPERRRHAILGSNGAGKTTLFNLISGDFPPTKGRIRLFGDDVTHMAPQERVRRGLRRTYQKTLLFPELSVRENFYLSAKGVADGRFSFIRSRPNDSAIEEAKHAAELVGLSDVLTERVASLSYGQQRQLEIGMALAGKPRFILFDEPAAGLSPFERENLVKLLHGLPKELGFVIIEHDLEIALAVSERITIMHNGAILTEGTADEIRSDPQVQAIYLGGRHG